MFENILLGLEGSRGVWTSIFGRVTAARRNRIFEVLKTVGLKEKADVKAGTLAHGQKQWLEIGCCLRRTLSFFSLMNPPPA